MHHAKTAYLTTVASILRKGGKNYCNATQGRTLDLLKDIHSINIKVRCLKKHIAELVDQGYIKTIRRFRRNGDGTCTGLPSAVCLTVKGASYLYKNGMTFALQLLKKLSKYTGYLKRKEAEEKPPEKKTPVVSPGERTYNLKDDPLYQKLRGKRRVFT